MLSYRHSYHAGNFADVLKHIVLCDILRHLRRKDAAFHYIDTHAGAGLFDLESAHATRLHEYRDGIARLTPAQWPELEDYFTTIQTVNSSIPDKQLRFYPGSPLIAAQSLRPQDRAWLFELHPGDYALLQANTRDNRRIRVSEQDGLQGLLALLPPVCRRALVLIDPSYEIKADYQLVSAALHQAWKRFPGGVYALWYPVVERARIQRLEQDLSDSGIRNIHRYELAVRADDAQRGMTAAGMIVVNPPWTQRERMLQLLPRLCAALAMDQTASWRCDELVAE